jgi:hypothetical protein
MAPFENSTNVNICRKSRELKGESRSHPTFVRRSEWSDIDGRRRERQTQSTDEKGYCRKEEEEKIELTQMYCFDRQATSRNWGEKEMSTHGYNAVQSTLQRNHSRKIDRFVENGYITSCSRRLKIKG